MAQLKGMAMFLLSTLPHSLIDCPGWPASSLPGCPIHPSDTLGLPTPQVNPLIHAVELREWDCIEMLVPRALKYNFSTGLLQEGMMDFVVAGNIDMMQKLLVTHQIPGLGASQFRAAFASSAFRFLRGSENGNPRDHTWSPREVI